MFKSVLLRLLYFATVAVSYAHDLYFCMFACVLGLARRLQYKQFQLHYLVKLKTYKHVVGLAHQGWGVCLLMRSITSVSAKLGPI